MAEPRARLRSKGQVFSTGDLSDLLYAYGDHTRTPASPSPLPLTVSALDEILTDFIIETCHAAALSASYSRRQKIKVDDFKFVLRKDERLLGRVLEQMARERRLKDQRKAMDVTKLAGEGVEGLGELQGIAEQGGAKAEMTKKRKKRKRRVDDDGAGLSKRVAS